MKVSTTTPDEKSRNYSDISTWNAARLIGEIFGWEHLTDSDWESLKECPPQRLGAGTLRTSIYEELEPLWNQCDPESRNYAPLKPSDTVNQNLLAFVDIMTTRFANGENDGGKHHHMVVSEVLERIRSDLKLSQKSEILRSISGYAEGEMEKYYGRLVNEKMESEDYIENNRIPANATPKQKLAFLKEALKPFPYPDNYVKIIEAETALMQRPLDPHYFRIEDMDEETLQRGNGVIAQKIATIKDKASELMETLTGEGSLTRNVNSFDNLSITFPGSGSLPLTGIMLHIRTGAKINLIDIDPDAVKESRRLIANLEKLGLVQTGAIQVIEGNVVDMRYQKDNRDSSHTAINADTVRATMKNNLRAKFVANRIGRRATKGSEFNGTFDDTLVKDDFEYISRYSLPDKQTPYALSFTGYKDVNENGKRYTLSHQIYFDKNRGWRRSQDRQLIPSDIVFLASLIPEELRQKVVDAIQKQTVVPDAIMMRSVKGLAQLAYAPTNTNKLADSRAPFYGEAVPETHIVHTDELLANGKIRGASVPFNPSLVVADSEVLNSTEIHHLPFYRVLRGRTDAKSEYDRLDQIEKDVTKTNIKMKALMRTASDPAKTEAQWAFRDISVTGRA